MACSRSATTASPLLGLVVVTAVLFVLGRADLRQSIETTALGWLQSRHEARAEPAEVEAVHAGRTGRRQPRDGLQPERTDAPAGRRGTLAGAALPRRARTGQPSGAGSLGRGAAGRRRADPDPGHHGHRVQLQPVRPESGRRAGPDAGHDARARPEVRALRRRAGRVRSGDQPARSACRCSRSASRVPAASRPACATTSAPATRPTTTATPGKVLAEQGYLKHVAGGKAVPATAPLTSATAGPPKAVAAQPAKIEDAAGTGTRGPASLIGSSAGVPRHRCPASTESPGRMRSATLRLPRDWR